jgi:hypothetical protein
MENIFAKPKPLIICNASLPMENITPNKNQNIYTPRFKKTISTAPEVTSLTRMNTSESKKLTSLNSIGKFINSPKMTSVNENFSRRFEVSNLHGVSDRSLLREMMQICFGYLPMMENLKLTLMEDNIEDFAYSLFRRFCDQENLLDFSGLKNVFQNLNIFVSYQIIDKIIAFLKRKSQTQNHWNMQQRMVTFSKR